MRPGGRETHVQSGWLRAAQRAPDRRRSTAPAPVPTWRFASLEPGRGRTTIALGGAGAARLVLPEVRGLSAQGTPPPAPTALRGRPSRPFPASNGG